MDFKNNRDLLLIFTIAVLFVTSLLSTVHATEKEYVLRPDDVLQISVWKEADLQREVLIRPDGKISFPLVGHIQAAGRTPEILQEAIVEKLGRYIPDPVVTVTVARLGGYKIYVLGQVARPGQYVVPQVDVMQALSLAGGLTRFANEKNINVLRRNGEGQQVFPFNYNEVAEGEKLRQNIILQPGDVLVVQ